jgi:hypothetical protein
MKRCSCGFLKYLCRFRKREGRCVALSRMVVNPYSVVPSEVVASWGTNYKYYTDSEEGITMDGASLNSRVVGDGNGNAYIAQPCSGLSFNFMGTTLRSNAGASHLVVAKINSSGNVDWTAHATRSTATNQTYPTDITIDSNNRIVICGTFRNTTAATLTFGSTTLTNAGTGDDIFIARVNTDGTWHSARSIGSASYNEVAQGVCADGSGNIYVVGTFMGSLTIDGVTITATSTTIADLFLAKFDSSNNLVWLRSWGTTTTDISGGVVCDSAGNVYVSGVYANTTITVGSVTFPTPAGLQDGYVLKFNSSGTSQWVATVRSTSADYANAIDISSDGSEIIVGGRSGTTSVSTTFLSADSSTVSIGVGTGTSQAPYIAKLNSSGIWQWGTRISPTGGVARNSQVTAIKVLTNNSIAVGGWFSAGSSIAFNSNTITAASNGSLSQDGFYSVFNSSGVGQWGTRVGLSNDSTTVNRPEYCTGVAQITPTQLVATNYNRNYNTSLTLGGQTISASTGSNSQGFLVKQNINGTWEV